MDDNPFSNNLSNPSAVNFAEAIRQTLPQSHSANAMLRSARLEHLLQIIIEQHMPNLSKRLQAKLFEGYGPLGSFSGKIDLAFALGFIEDVDRRTLHAIREIRNFFAHSMESASFYDDRLKSLMAKLPPVHEGLLQDAPQFIFAPIIALKIAFTASSSVSPRSG